MKDLFVSSEQQKHGEYPFCVDCKYFDDPECTHPLAEVPPIISLVYGPRESFLFAADMRGNTCGKEAALFEQSEI